VRKELRPGLDHGTCDVCGRTILKGERTEAYLDPGGHRREVCDLCFQRAEHHGWIREATAGEVPRGLPRDEPRRGVLGRLRRRRPPARTEPAHEEPAYPEQEVHYGNGADPSEADHAAPDHEPAPPPRPRPRSRPKDPRHVRAVPTTAEVRAERALELFNGSDHARTVAGLARTLGTPWVTASPDADQPASVTVVVAWELSWYRFRVDLGDEADPVMLLEKGEEIDEIEEDLRRWNATIDTDGRLVAGAAVEGEAEE
jgi:hypothetical protein